MKTATQSETEDVNLRRLGARLLGTGSAGLLATCICYVLAGPEAALPGGAPDTAVALTATASSAFWMRCAGLLGVPSDVVLAAGASLLALSDRRDNAAGVVGWLALAIASVLFIVVDAMVALVLPALSLQPTAQSSYPAFRLLFDALFTAGTWTAGLGALALAWSRTDALFDRAWVGWGMRLAGFICLAASTAFGLQLSQASLLMGPGVALLAVSGWLVAGQINRSVGSCGRW